MSEPVILKYQSSPLFCEEIFEDTFIMGDSHEWMPEVQNYIANIYKPYDLYDPDIEAFTRQKDISEQMRGILLDWLMEVCCEFFLKRETFYLTVSNVDRLISSTYVTKEEFQLIGVSCLYIACKSEEVKVPKLQDLVKAASCLYPASQIISTEKKILRILQWKIYPLTPYNILNTVLVEWDNYLILTFSDYIKYVSRIEKDKIRQQDLLNQRLLTFKRENTYSYKRFREILQVLDISILDYKFYRFKTYEIIAALIYLMTSNYFRHNKFELLWWNSLLLNSNFLISEEEISLGSEAVVLLIEKFLLTVFRISSLKQLEEPLRFLNRFRELIFCNAPPPVTKVVRNVQEHYENFLSYQTYNSRSKRFLSTHPYNDI